ncbi:MAG: hypothetical protein H6707_11495 [Deltaproteobacteria bacterium]|nr:hypothetical protein [Deltaproteobacteria bacterium]
MNRLIQYLLSHLILDFQGDLTLDMVREFLREDNSRDARALLARLVEERGVEDMMVALADCLQEHIPSGITPDALQEQIRLYAES